MEKQPLYYEKIDILHKRAKAEAKAALKKIYAQYQEEIVSIVKQQLKEGQSLVMGNGLAFIIDANGETALRGQVDTVSMYGTKIKGLDSFLNKLSLLQYPDEFNGFFKLPETIKR